MSGPASLPELLADRARETPRDAAFRTSTAGGSARDETWTWERWSRESDAFAAALLRRGWGGGERLAVLAGNHPAWPVADVGAQAAGAVSVGLYPSSAPDQVRHVLADSGASTVVVDAPEQLDKVAAVAPELPALTTVVTTFGRHGPVPGADVVTWDGLLAEGATALKAGARREIERRARDRRGSDPAVLIYTSGSTGEPRGATLDHACLVASAASVRDTLGLRRDDTTLSFLPYCHAAERVFGLATRLLVGMETTLVPDHTRVFEAARSWGPTLFGGLPRFYEKVHEALLAEREGSSPEERERFDRVLELGRTLSRARREGRPVQPAAEEEWRTRGGPFFARVRDHFGGRVRLATSGGATLPEEVAETLDALGLTVLGAYGLTEHLCAAFNRPGRYSFDSAGPAMPGTELRVADDGEILVRRSALTFAGYHGRPDDTRDAFDASGEWLHTGDLGAIDDRGFLRITGRKKELIALSTGKKVAPVPIEARLVERPWIAQAVLHGEGRRFLSALLTLRRPVVEAWAREEGLDLAWEELCAHPAVRAELEEQVRRACAGVSRTESVRGFAVLERPLSVEAGELTATLKVRRHVVEEEHRERLEALYGKSDEPRDPPSGASPADGGEAAPARRAPAPAAPGRPDR